MTDPADVVEAVLGFIGDILNASSLRFDVIPTLVVLGVLLAFLQLVARPVTRWASSDPGGLTAISRAMALAAESGTDAIVSLGAAGLGRSTDALARLQTMAAMPILAHVGRAAARSGVPLRVLTNDPLAGVVAAATLESAHAATGTPERSSRSRTVVVGEGRPAMGGLVLTARARPAAAIAVGSLREEAQLHLAGLQSGAGSMMAGTAEGAEAPSVLLGTTHGLVGPEPYQAAADLRPQVEERTAVLAANRLIWLAVAAIGIGSALALAGVVDLGDLLVRTIGG